MLSFTTRGNFIDFKYTEDVVPNQVHLILTLHNSSKCITWGYGENETHIDFRIDDANYNQIPITSIYFDGVVMSTQADFKTNIEAMFPGLAGGGSPGGSDKQVQYNNAGALGGISNGDSGQVLTSNGAGSAPSFQAAGGSSYLVYTAFLTQNLTDAPVANVLENTVGAGLWTRVDVGIYRCLTTTDFDVTKIWVSGGVFSEPDQNTQFISVFNGIGALQCSYKLLITNSAGKIRLDLTIYDNSETEADLSSLSVNQLMIPEVRVYP